MDEFDNMSQSFISEEHLREAIGFDEYVKRAVRRVEKTDPESIDGAERVLLHYVSLNNHRMKRILNQYSVPTDLRSKIGRISEPQIWLVITEDWCGDSAQSLPHIAQMAEVNPLIELKILHRDEHPELMDRYLTDGKRGIPKLIAIDENRNELFRWGPRPKEAAALFKETLDSGLSKTEAYERLHLWYARNRGRAIEAELDELISQFIIADETVVTQPVFSPRIFSDARQ